MLAVRNKNNHEEKRHALDKKSCPLSVKVQGLELEDPDRASVVGAMNEGIHVSLL
jgi:hypothetical protein